MPKLVSQVSSWQTNSLKAREDVIGGLGKHERLRVVVVELDSTRVIVLKQVGSSASSTVQVSAYNVWADQIDTPRVITRSSDQAIVWRWDTAEPFGATAPDQNPNALGSFVFNQRFPGQLLDTETGNSIGLNGGINTYVYVAGNSLNVIP